MTGPLLLGIIQAIIGEAFAIWKWARQDRGLDIPEWDQILANNDALQAKIDAELRKGGTQ